MLKNFRAYIRHRNSINYIRLLLGAMDKIMATEVLRMCKETETSAWITLHLYKSNGTGFKVQEWMYNILLHYGIAPLDLPHRCDGCG